MPKKSLQKNQIGNNKLNSCSLRTGEKTLPLDCTRFNTFPTTWLLGKMGKLKHWVLVQPQRQSQLSFQKKVKVALANKLHQRNRPLRLPWNKQINWSSLSPILRPNKLLSLLLRTCQNLHSSLVLMLKWLKQSILKLVQGKCRRLARCQSIFGQEKITEKPLMQSQIRFLRLFQRKVLSLTRQSVKQWKFQLDPDANFAKRN